MSENTTPGVLTDQAYNFWKKVTQLYLPAIASLYFGLATIWGLPAAEQVVGTIALIDTFLGIVLNISTNRYNEVNASNGGAFVIDEDPGGIKNISLELNRPPELLTDLKSVTLKVVRNQVP